MRGTNVKLLVNPVSIKLYDVTNTPIVPKTLAVSESSPVSVCFAGLKITS